jgi:hypothetical protein
MSKRVLTILIVLSSILAFSSPAWSSVEGIWYVQGKVTTKVSAKGHGSKTIKGNIDDIWTFNGDGDFETENIGGAWSQTKKKFTVNLDMGDIINNFEDMLSEELETDITVEEITKTTLTGTEKKNGKMSGSFKIYMNIYSSEQDIHGKAKVSGNFKGTLLQAPALDVSGYWKVYHTEKGSETGPDYLSLSQSGNRITGTFTSGYGDNIGEEYYISGNISGSSISMILYQDVEVTITGSAGNDAMSGTYKAQGQSGTWRAERIDSIPSL